MKGIILHGGHGTRLGSLTRIGPKQLIPVANKPVSQYVLEALLDCGIRDIGIVLGDFLPEKVKERYGDGSRFGARITYIHQGEPRGIAHAVGLCQEYVEDSPFVVCLGDNLFQEGIETFVEGFQAADAGGRVVLSRAERPERFGVAKLDKEGRLVGVVEKPKVPPSPYVITGVYIFRPIVFEMILRLKSSRRNELEITDAIQLLMDKGHSVDYRLLTGWWRDTGTAADILDSNRLILEEMDVGESDSDPGSKIQGRVRMGLDCEISERSLIEGPVVLGDDVEIGDSVHIGPFTSIGNDVKIRRGEIENSIVMDHCYIDMGDRITASLIGPYSRITSTVREGLEKGHNGLGERSIIRL